MQQYRPDIDGLRMLAVAPVVLYHAGVPWLPGGYVGVDIFFVISGFLITRILYGEISAGKFSLIGFYERRARRILPSLFGVLIASYVAAWIILLPHDFEEFANSSIAATLFASNIWFYKTTSNYFANTAEFQPLLHTWSLAVEEQFYIVFPVLLLVFARFSKKITILLIVIMVFLSFSAAATLVSSRPWISFYLAPMRGWELGIGALLALGAAPRLNQKWVREVVALIGFSAILFSVFTYDDRTPFPGIAALPPCLGAAALILVGTHGGSAVSRLLSLKPFVFIGLISYSLYLWHWPILSFLRIWLGDVNLSVFAAFAAVALSFAAATLSWAFIEKPFRRRPPIGYKTSTIFQLSAAVIICFVAVGGWVSRSNGLPGRIPPEIYQVYNILEDLHPDTLRCDKAMDSGRLCRIGAEKEADTRVDFLLWGDSHARSMIAGFADAAEQSKKTGLYAGQESCPPMLGVYRSDQGTQPICADFNEHVFDQLNKREDIDVVILAARWAESVEGKRMPGEGGPTPKLAWAKNADLGRNNLNQNFEIFQEALPATIARIRATGRQVIVLGQVPEIGWNVPPALVSHLRWRRPLPEAPTISSIAKRQKRVNVVLSALENEPGVRVISVAQFLCDPDCKVHLDGKPLYADDDHLSRYGSDYVIGSLFLGEIWN